MKPWLEKRLNHNGTRHGGAYPPALTRRRQEEHNPLPAASKQTAEFRGCAPTLGGGGLVVQGCLQLHIQPEASMSCLRPVSKAIISWKGSCWFKHTHTHHFPKLQTRQKREADEPWTKYKNLEGSRQWLSISDWQGFPHKRFTYVYLHICVSTCVCEHHGRECVPRPEHVLFVKRKRKKIVCQI